MVSDAAGSKWRWRDAILRRRAQVSQQRSVPVACQRQHGPDVGIGAPNPHWRHRIGVVTRMMASGIIMLLVGIVFGAPGRRVGIVAANHCGRIA